MPRVKQINDTKLNPIAYVHDDGHIELAGNNSGWTVTGDKVQDSKGIVRVWNRGNYIETYGEDGKYQKTLTIEGENITYGGTREYNVWDYGNGNVTSPAQPTPKSQEYDGSRILDSAGALLELAFKGFELADSARMKAIAYQNKSTLDAIFKNVKTELRETNLPLGPIMQEYERFSEIKYFGMFDISKYGLDYNTTYSDFARYLKRTANLSLQNRKLNLLGILSNETKQDLTIINSFVTAYFHKLVLDFCKQTSKPVPPVEQLNEEIVKDIYATVSTQEALKKIDAQGLSFVIRLTNPNLLSKYNKHRMLKLVGTHRKEIDNDIYKGAKKIDKLYGQVITDYRATGKKSATTLGQLCEQFLKLGVKDASNIEKMIKDSKYYKNIDYNVRYEDGIDFLNSGMVFIETDERKRHISNYENLTPYEKSPITTLNSWLTFMANVTYLQYCQNKGIKPVRFFHLMENGVSNSYLLEYYDDILDNLFSMFRHWPKHFDKVHSKNKQDELEGRSF